MGLEECNKRGDCKGIVTTVSHDKCWGKEDLTARICNPYGGRTLYEKI